MFRALSTRAGRGYEKLGDEESAALVDPKLDRARSVPAKIFGAPKKSTSQENGSAKSVSKQAKKASKIHPLFNLFDRGLRRKATAKPEFSRYVQYLKEGGIWDVNSNTPAIYYR